MLVIISQCGSKYQISPYRLQIVALLHFYKSQGTAASFLSHSSISLWLLASYLPLLCFRFLSWVSLSRDFLSFQASSTMSAQEVQNNNGASENVESKAAASITAFKPKLPIPAPAAADAVKFYRAAFGAEEVIRDVTTKRKADQEIPHIISSQMKLGSTVFIVYDRENTVSEAKYEGAVFCLETENVEAAIAKAVSAGAVKASADDSAAEGEDGGACYGRVEKVTDPYGFVWAFCAPGSV